MSDIAALEQQTTDAEEAKNESADDVMEISHNELSTDQPGKSSEEPVDDHETAELEREIEKTGDENASIDNPVSNEVEHELNLDISDKKTLAAILRFLNQHKLHSSAHTLQKEVGIDVTNEATASEELVVVNKDNVSSSDTKKDDKSKNEAVSDTSDVTFEMLRQINKTKVYYGLPKEPDLQNMQIEDDDEGGDGEEKPKKKKAKKDPALSKKSRTDPNAPPNNRIPLPEWRDSEKQERANAYRESLRRVKLGPNSLPSICFYTLTNAHWTLSAVDIADDSSILAAGFSDGRIRVWSLTPQRLRGMKSAAELETIDREADDVYYRMMDERNAPEMRLLVAHSGPVTAVSISPDVKELLSASEDATIRLWSLLTWTNVVCYKGHCFPVWDVKFSPYGYYFASAGYDKTARLWATDSYQPLRLFVGHNGDVDCVQFHPNANYVATGCGADGTIRLWDVLNGANVRLMVGMSKRSLVHSMQFSTDGRLLAAAGSDTRLYVWDIATGNRIAELHGHTGPVLKLCFSRDGTILASGGLDCCVKLWDMGRLVEECDFTDSTISPRIYHPNEGMICGSFRTKATAVLALHFTRRNLMLVSGAFLAPNMI